MIKYKLIHFSKRVSLLFNFHTLNIMQVPREFVLHTEHRVMNGKLVQHKDCYYGISLLESLQSLLRTDIVREQVCTANVDLK